MNEEGTSVIRYIPNAIEIKPEWFEEVWSNRPEINQSILMLGKEIPLPRRHKTYGGVYKFNGCDENVLPFTELHYYMITKIQELFNEVDMPDSCLVNWYANGDEYIGYHSDNETNLVAGKSIYIISWGASRVLKFKNKKNKNVSDFLMTNGSAIAMDGTLQKTHKHCIPKSKKVKERRISFTFRFINHR
jgi:alkylated DNA repair dioxygenase AlkB